MIYTKGQTLQASLLNSNSELSILGAFGLVEDNVTELMGELKIDGITAKEKYGAIWVFTKNRVRIMGSISWNENFTVESYISSKSLVKFTIDTVIKNGEGKAVFVSRAEICGLDINTGRIRKIDTIGVDSTVEVVAPEFDIEYTRFDGELGSKVEDIQVRATNIDYLHHCNNIEYLRFILNTYPNSVVVDNIKELEIVYASQCFEGENLSIYKNTVDSNDFVYILRGDSVVTKCEIVRE